MTEFGEHFDITKCCEHGFDFRVLGGEAGVNLVDVGEFGDAFECKPGELVVHPGAL